MTIFYNFYVEMSNNKVGFVILKLIQEKTLFYLGFLTI